MKAREYFNYTKRERTGIICLMIILMLTIFVPRFFCGTPAPVAKIPVEKSEERDSFKQDVSGYEKYVEGRKTNYAHSPLHGGGYDQHHFKRFKQQERTRKKIDPFDINSADTTAFIALPGIGSKLAARIIAFREKLGGFYDVAQIHEVYGVADSVYRKILPFLKCDSTGIRRININIAEKETLKEHPYIRWNIANEVLAYRTQHGSFVSAMDLEKLVSIDAATLRKMLHYISFK